MGNSEATPAVQNVYVVQHSGVGNQKKHVVRVDDGEGGTRFITEYDSANSMWLKGDEICDADLAGLDVERLLRLGAIALKTEMVAVTAPMPDPEAPQPATREVTQKDLV